MLRVEALLSNLEHYFLLLSLFPPFLAFLAISLFLSFSSLVFSCLLVFAKVSRSNTIPPLMIFAMNDTSDILCLVNNEKKILTRHLLVKKSLV